MAEMEKTEGPEPQDQAQETKITRRAFLGATVAGALTLSACNSFPTIVPRHVLGGYGFVPPSERVRIAKIGCNGMGKCDLDSVKADNYIVALCDADYNNAAVAFKEFPNVPKYHDFRKMLDELDNKIDAVMVSTPDHFHAVASITSMKRGKHVFCQKPLTHDIYEARQMTKIARKYNRATQMGIQGHADEGIRLMEEWMMHYNAIGKVREVHIWTDRWPQTLLDRPKETPPVPAGLDWDVWIGPAHMRPYNPCYLPGSWRAWWEFGCGALGDIGCHSFDAPFKILKLGYPTSVEAVNSDRYPEVAPKSSVITYQFPARGDLPPVKVVWYDGRHLPPRPKDLDPGRKLEDNGQLFLGDSGTIMCGMYGENPQLLPREKMREINHRKLEKIIPRSIGHYQEWIRACKGGAPAGANFDYSGPLTEVVQLGNLAVRTGERIEFDPVSLKVTSSPAANKLIRREYRKGWKL